MTVFFGANDAVLPGQLQHIPLEEYRKNLKSILMHQALKQHDTKFVLITPPPICEYMTQEDDASKGKPEIQRLAANTKKYVEVVLSVGKDMKVPTVNLWGAFMQYAGGWEEGKPFAGSKEIPPNEKLQSLLRDGLHLNPKGYEVMYDAVMKTIREAYPEYDPEKLQFIYPYWADAPKMS